MQLSFELFPPKTAAGLASLPETVSSLQEAEPSFFSVTYGALGSARESSRRVIDLLHTTPTPIAPHITCAYHTRNELVSLVEQYAQQGISRLVVLRGDRPAHHRKRFPGELKHASDLVALTRKYTGNQFHISVAAFPEIHPESESLCEDIETLKRKVDAGADSAITQYFFNPHDYERFMEASGRNGIGIPIIPGILPVTSYADLVRFSERCGAGVPRWLRRDLQKIDGDAGALAAYRVEVGAWLCTKLLEAGAPGLHFYTLNKAESTMSILKDIARV